jgi:hypothetical protein
VATLATNKIPAMSYTTTTTTTTALTTNTPSIDNK